MIMIKICLIISIGGVMLKLHPSITILLIISAAIPLFFLYSVGGRSHRPDFPEFYGLLCAHRGLFKNAAPYDRPENSLGAFRAAVEAGYGIELDVRFSRDKKLVVFHDDTLKRLCGEDIRVCDLTADELASRRILGGTEHIPLFREALDVIGGAVPIIVEIKCPKDEKPVPLCKAVAEMLDGYDGPYCVESFNPKVVRWFRKNRPQVFIGQLSDAFLRDGHRGADYFAMHHLLVNLAGRPDFVAYNCRHADAAAFRVWRNIYRSPAAAWTVRSQKELDAIRDYYDCYIFEGFIPDENKMNENKNDNK